MSVSKLDYENQEWPRVPDRKISVEGDMLWHNPNRGVSRGLDGKACRPILISTNLEREVILDSHILAHETAQTHRKSSSRSFDPGRRSSTGYSCAPSKSKQSNAALIVGIVSLRRWPWRHNTNAIFPATSKLRLAVIAVHCIVEQALINILHNLDMRNIVKKRSYILFCNIGWLFQCLLLEIVVKRKVLSELF